VVCTSPIYSCDAVEMNLVAGTRTSGVCILSVQVTHRLDTTCAHKDMHVRRDGVCVCVCVYVDLGCTVALCMHILGFDIE
jgi:hypothetical protein